MALNFLAVDAPEDTSFPLVTERGSVQAFPVKPAGGGSAAVTTYNDAQLPQYGSSFVQGALDAAKGLNPATSQILWVQKGGNDLTATGTPYKPFATLPAALLAAVAGGAATSKRFAVFVGPGNFSEALTLVPWVAIIGAHQNATRITGAVTIGAGFTPNIDQRAWLSNLTISTSLAADFNAQASNQGKLTFQNVTFNVTPVFTAFSAINQVVAQNCVFLAGWTQNGINSSFYNACFQNGGTIALNSINDGRNLPTLLTALGGGSDGDFHATWATSTGSNNVLFQFAGFGVANSMTLDGSGVQGFCNPGTLPPTLTLLNSAPSPRPVVTGAKAGNAALTDLLTQLQGVGLITDATT